jgi:DNA-binding winged helix-turn-helix (wHTH) protein/TolB-like protein
MTHRAAVGHNGERVTSASRLRFADFEVDLDTGELWRLGEAVRIQDLPFRLLAALIERPGELVSRADLGQRLWGTDTFVDFDAGVNTAVAKLREALQDSPDQPRFIETVPKRGYRFLGHIESGMPTASSQLGPPASGAMIETPVPRSRRRLVTAAVIAIALVVGGVGWAWHRRGPSAPTRVAVALFDNETGQASFDRLAQALTDSTVAGLAASPTLAVIGNAAVLRTVRPFRDLEVIRDTLHADLIVIGQVQAVDGHVRVLTHLIRASDQTHIWVQSTPLAASGEAALQVVVAERVSAAVSAATARRP